MHDFEKAFNEALPGHAEDQLARSKTKHADMGAPMGLLSINDITTAAGTLCTNWPKIKGFLTMAISAVGWMFPTQAAMAKAVIEAIEKTVIPVVCQK
jgi:hypothetical protein